jgi:hypothetical protein|tara:strand:+ start:3136 stop:3810 length:675 start_codon:yes stop_codon:yes gene_type:complete
MLKNHIRKVILETKEKKEKLLIEQNLVNKRILMIFESENNIKNFKSLSKSKKEKIAYKLISEINYLKETNLLNEDLKDFLGKMFGDNFTNVLDTVINPMVESLMKSLELSGYFKDSMISYLSSDPTKFSQALRSCDELSKLVADSLSDALDKRIQQQTGFDSQESKFINGALSDAIKEPRFSENLENRINSVVCDLFDTINDKAKKVYEKLKPSVEELGGILTP